MFVYTGTVERQGSLLGLGPPAVDPSAAIERIELEPGSWVDVARCWLAGSDTLLDRMIDEIPWRQGRRQMWGRWVDEPRQTWWPDRTAPRDGPIDLEFLRTPLIERYRRLLGRPGCNHYRDGHDSVAFHGDRELRNLDDTLVAIVTLGAVRPFLIRPSGGGASIDLRPAGGDLIVMGGRTQRGFEHAVPKCRTAGPRVSITFRTAAR